MSADMAPKILAVFGAVGAGKTTARKSVMQLLEMDVDTCVNCITDEIQENMPEYKTLFESGDKKQLNRFCDESWADVKNQCRAKMHAALTDKSSLFLEWSYEGHPQTLAKGENIDLPADKWEPYGYVMVLCLVKCLDLDGVLANVKRRQEKDGRHIKPDTVMKSQKDRSLHFVNAAVDLRERALQYNLATPTFVVAIRRSADADAQITELKAEELVRCESEDEAQALLDRLEDEAAHK